MWEEACCGVARSEPGRAIDAVCIGLCSAWLNGMHVRSIALPQVLREVFGPELATEVAARYLQEQSNGRYRFRQQYARWAVGEQEGVGSVI